MKRWLRRAAPVLAATLWLSAQAFAYTVEPSVLKLGGSGGDSSAFLRLSNRAAQPVAIELAINEFDRDIDGRGIVGREADEDFIVYPAQVILMPGDETSVQVRWIGEAVSNVERAFTLTTREVAIPRKEPEPQESSADGARINVNVLTNYDVRIYVTPRGAKPNVIVEATNIRTEAQGTAVEVTLANRGTAHHPLRDLSLILMPLEPGGTSPRQSAATLSASDVPGMSAALLAGGRRRLLIPWPAGLPPGSVRAIVSQ